MSYIANVLTVMIASPGDCREEREAARIVITDWNALHAEKWRTVLLPLLWERDVVPGAKSNPQDAIDAEIVAKADILVAIFKHTVGTAVAGADPGTVHEIALCRAADKDVQVYFYGGDVPRTVDPVQTLALREYRTGLRDEVLYAEFDTPANLASKVHNNLLRLIGQKAEDGSIKTPMSNDQIRDEAQRAAVSTAYFFNS